MVTVTAPSITTSQPPRAAQSTPCEAFFAAGDQHAELLDPPGTAYRTLWEAMRDAAGGGKGARPQLVTRTYAALGGTDLEVATHVGDAVELLPDEIPVFWACGVTPQAVIAQAKPPFAITHAPGSMLVTDRRNTEFAVI